MDFALSILFGGLVGFSLGLTGGGGSLLAVPLLVYGLAIAPRDAFGISLAAVGATALVGVIPLIRRGEVELGTGTWFAAAGMVGAPLGTWIGGRLPETVLLGLFAALMLAVATQMWRRAGGSAVAGLARVQATAECGPGSAGPRSVATSATGGGRSWTRQSSGGSDLDDVYQAHPKSGDSGYGEDPKSGDFGYGEDPKSGDSGYKSGDSGSGGPSCQRDDDGRLRLTSRCAAVLAVVGLATGIMTGMFGVGGGFVIVPALVLFSGMTIHRAIATSLWVIVMVSSAGVASYVAAGRTIAPWITGMFVIGGFAGLRYGRRLAQRLSGPTLQKSFAAAIIIVAVLMIVRTLSQA